ncbi:MAG: hypothetical protein JXB39_14635 [Deltaproteobacteria bacterium]|nr:hypothetical protein [Deltaproteobacteria bacterium]
MSAASGSSSEDARSHERSAHPGRSLGILLAVVLLVAAWVSSGHWSRVVDDAYITVRYAWNLVQGQGLVFNPGERVEGFSNPTWLFLLAPFLAVGVDPMWVAKILGLTSHLAAVAGTALLARTLARREGIAPDAAAAVAAGFLAVSLPASYWAVQGLETSFFAALLVLSLWRLAEEDGQGGVCPASAVLAGIAMVTRPEAPLFVAGIALGRLLGALHRREGWRPLVRWGIPFVLPGAAWLTFRLAYYGYPLPNTFYAKGNPAPLHEVLGYLHPWLALEAPFALAGAVGLVVLLAFRSRRSVALILVLAAELVFVRRCAGDWMPNQRLLVALLPLLGAAAGAATAMAAASLGPRVLRWAPVLALAALVGFQGARSVPMAESEQAPDGRPAWTPRQDWQWFPASVRGPWHGALQDVAAFLLQRIPPDATLAYSEIGLTGHAGGWVLVDILGLTDATLSGADGSSPVDAIEYIHRRAPDWILLRPADRAGLRVGRLREAAWLYEEYDLEEGPAGGFTLAARKGTRRATPEEVVSALARAARLAPRFVPFHEARVAWMGALPAGEARSAVCRDLRARHPHVDRLLADCETALETPPPLPDVSPRPLVRVSETTDLPVGSRAEGAAPGALSISGRRITLVDPVQWRSEDVQVGIRRWTLPAAFAKGVEVSDVRVGARLCPLDSDGPGTCGIVAQRLAVFTEPGDPPTEVSFAVPLEVAEAEAILRGIGPEGGPAARAAYEVPGTGLVIPAFSSLTRIPVPEARPGASLRFRPVRLASLLFESPAEPSLVVTAWARTQKHPPIVELWNGSPSGPDAPPVEVALDLPDAPQGVVLGIRAPKSTSMRLGALLAIADPVLSAVASTRLVAAERPPLAAEDAPLPDGRDLGALATGRGLEAVTVDGDRVAVRAGFAWKAKHHQGRALRVFPVPFTTGLIVSDVIIDGRPCTMGGSSSPCLLLNRALAVARAPEDPDPVEVSFRVPAEAAAEERRIRGLQAGAPSAVVRLEGFERPAVFGHGGGARVVLDPVEEGSVVVFRPVVLDSPVFASPQPLTFELTVHAGRGPRAASRVAWTGRGDVAGLVRVPLQPGECASGPILTLRVPGISPNRLGHVPLWADLRLVGPETHDPGDEG